jgi:chorismate mutase
MDDRKLGSVTSQNESTLTVSTFKSQDFERVDSMRGKVRELDVEISSLILKRAALSAELGSMKVAMGLKLRNLKVEDLVKELYRAELESTGASRSELNALTEALLAVCRSAQHLKIAKSIIHSGTAADGTNVR